MKGDTLWAMASRYARATGLQVSQLSGGPCTNNIFTGQSLHTVTLYVLAGLCTGMEQAGRRLAKASKKMNTCSLQ